MITDQENAINRIAGAKKLAVAHGVDVLGWNDKPGREFISVNGAGDKLLALQKEMEKLGWHTWPVDEDQTGAFMDFAMRPPPAPAKSTDTTIDEETDKPTPPTAAKFHYAGPGSLFLTQWPWLSLLATLIILRLKSPVFSTRLVIAIAVDLLIFAGLLVCNWIEISANDRKLTVQKHFRGKIQTFDLADIKAARIFKQKDRRGKVTTDSVTVSLKFGKRFDLFLPRKRQKEFVARFQAPTEKK